MRKKYKECWDKKDYQGMLRAARADVTKYTICHKSHTVPALKNGFPYAPKLFEIDIDALADYVDFLITSYRELNLENEIPAVLERLRTNISAPRWNQKITYFQTLCALGEQWNVPAGKAEIKKLGSIGDIDDPEILSLYLNLIRDELSMSETIKFIDRVRENSLSLSTKIHQGAVKAILLYCHNDRKGSVETLAEVIDLLDNEKEGDLDAYQSNKYAQCLYLLGAIGIDTNLPENKDKAMEFLSRAKAQFNQLLNDSGFTTRGLAEIYRGLADCHRVADEWGEAIEAYTEAFKLDGRPIHRVFEAECLYEAGKVGGALKIIDDIDLESLEDEESKNDFEVRFSRIAILEQEPERLNKANKLLGSARTLDPFFLGSRQKLQVDVLKAIQELGKSSKKPPGRFKLGLSKLSSYIILQPTMFGIGVNFNKVIEDGIKKQNEHEKLENNSKK